MKKEYIRTTHNFNNETHTWIYRGDRGQERCEMELEAISKELEEGH